MTECLRDSYIQSIDNYRAIGDKSRLDLKIDITNKSQFYNDKTLN